IISLNSSWPLDRTEDWAIRRFLGSAGPKFASSVPPNSWDQLIHASPNAQPVSGQLAGALFFQATADRLYFSGGCPCSFICAEQIGSSTAGSNAVRSASTLKRWKIVGYRALPTWRPTWYPTCPAWRRLPIPISSTLGASP